MEVLVLGEFIDIYGKKYILVGVFNKEVLLEIRYVDPEKINQ